MVGWSKQPATPGTLPVKIHALRSRVVSTKTETALGAEAVLSSTFEGMKHLAAGLALTVRLFVIVAV
jgi:hypothetical protein